MPDFNSSNPESFHRLYSDYYKALVAYAMRLLQGCDASAEDIVQDMFFTIWQKNLEFENEPHLKTYLYNAVRNNCLDALKHRQVEDAYIDKVKAASPEMLVYADGSEAAFEEEVYRELFAAIDRLPERQREIVLMAMEGKPNREIAAALGIGVETVKTHKRRAKDFLKDTLSPACWTLLLLLS